MVKLDKIVHRISLPDGVNASLEGNNVTISKDGNSVSREFRHPRLDISTAEEA
jgi:ribosomal protein L6P/L9E